eukprot:NODE_3292_length_1006_cov_27.864159_g3028_i0.p1 GENE.NODE_3292_length_1006_cov_27.864159_g3028_i0~~NODE_3292_length_1006_cov_27.864159_g3028_i0.p1  ORF type:complete len:316 (+),score=59.82 NODE_3292_length_1006_cov_27.864159_g3028_i0:57-950(+)
MSDRLIDFVLSHLKPPPGPLSTYQSELVLRTHSDEEPVSQSCFAAPIEDPPGQSSRASEWASAVCVAAERNLSARSSKMRWSDWGISRLPVDQNVASRKLRSAAEYRTHDHQHHYHHRVSHSEFHSSSATQSAAAKVSRPFLIDYSKCAPSSYNVPPSSRKPEPSNRFHALFLDEEDEEDDFDAAEAEREAIFQTELKTKAEAQRRKRHPHLKRTSRRVHPEGALGTVRSKNEDGGTLRRVVVKCKLPGSRTANLDHTEVLSGRRAEIHLRRPQCTVSLLGHQKSRSASPAHLVLSA